MASFGQALCRLERAAKFSGNVLTVNKDTLVFA
jgi:hypothetical protein